MIELTQTDMVNFFRPNFFTNTQDILTEFLQTGGPSAFKIRLVLAALLSPSYGIYSGFEFHENLPLREGSEEYLHSEKYELRHRDWSKKEGTLIPYLRRINRIRRQNPAFAQLTNLRWHETHNDNVLAFSKTAAGQAPILVLVTLDPVERQEATIAFEDFLHRDAGPFRAHELISESTQEWLPADNKIILDPRVEPACIFRVEG
jgi:starch synthase (maltosyl-transferring)